MPISKLSVGRDCTIDLFDPTQGAVVALDIITSFDAKQDATDLKSKGLDGVVRHGTEPDGWSGTIGLDRASAAIDNFFAIIEQAYYDGRNIEQGSLTQTIKESDGSISQFRFTGVTLKLDDAGNWQNGKFTAQKMSWHASRRIKIS